MAEVSNESVLSGPTFDAIRKEIESMTENQRSKLTNIRVTVIEKQVKDGKIFLNKVEKQCPISLFQKKEDQNLENVNEHPENTEPRDAVLKEEYTHSEVLDYVEEHCTESDVITKSSSQQEDPEEDDIYLVYDPVDFHSSSEEETSAPGTNSDNNQLLEEESSSVPTGCTLSRKRKVSAASTPKTGAKKVKQEDFMQSDDMSPVDIRTRGKSSQLKTRPVANEKSPKKKSQHESVEPMESESIRSPQRTSLRDYSRIKKQSSTTTTAHSTCLKLGNEHPDSDPECPECGKTFMYLSQMEKHLKKKTKCVRTDVAKDGDISDLAEEISKLSDSSENIMEEEDEHAIRNENPTDTNMFVCQRCGRSFQKQAQLTKHLKSKIPCRKPMDFPCTKCGKTFHYQSTFQRHQQKKNNCLKTPNTQEKKKPKKHQSKPYPCQCAECGKVLGSNHSLYYHKKIHENQHKPYKCSFCGKGFAQKTYVATHEKNVHEGSRPFQCNVCGLAFSKKSVLDYHQATHWEESIYKSMLKCVSCGAMLYGEDQVELHLQTHEPDNVNVTNPDMATHVLSVYPCIFSSCSEVFPQGLEWLFHIRDHRDSGAFDEQTLHLATLILLEHGSIFDQTQRYQCEKCGLEFLYKRKYTYHLAKHHREKKLLKCNYCEERFTANPEKHAHQLTHLEEYKYPCLKCNKRFRLPLKCQDHMREMHGLETVIKHENKRQQLPHRFSSMDRSQRSFPCQYCSKVFKSKWNRDTHLNTHTKERPFACTICSKTFSDRANMSHHMSRTHEDQPRPKKGTEFIETITEVAVAHLLEDAYEANGIDHVEETESEVL